MQPVDATEAVTKPAREGRSDQTEHVTEDGHCVGHDPRDWLAREADGNLWADGEEISSVHPTRAAGEADVDNVTVHEPR